MIATNKNPYISDKTVLVDTTELANEILHCGRVTAVKIGQLAGARVQIGKRVLWNIQKVNKYVDSISGD